MCICHNSYKRLQIKCIRGLTESWSDRETESKNLVSRSQQWKEKKQVTKAPWGHHKFLSKSDNNRNLKVTVCLEKKAREPQACKISPLKINYRNISRTSSQNDNLIWSNRPLDEREQTKNGKVKAKEGDGPETETWFKISGQNLKLNCNVQRQKDDKEMENGGRFPFKGTLTGKGVILI